MNTLKKHPNSRIVTIYRKDSFINDAQKGTALDFVSQSKKSIGSYWETSYSKTVGSGLNFAEQRLLMPTIVDCEPEDRNFREKVSNYFSSIKTNIPYEKGRSLEIGLTESNTDLVSKENQPLNLADYITYRHALAHPLVAANKQAAEGNMLKEFYIFDSMEVESRQMVTNENKDKALELYLTIKKTPEKADMLLTLLDTDPRTFVGVNKEKLKFEALKKLSESKPDKFVELYDNKLFEHLYVLQSMVNTNVLKRIGEKIIDPENGETIGHNTAESVAWLKDPVNSERVVMLRARMQEGLAAPLPATAKLVR